MQVSAINSTNFGKNEYSSMVKKDIQKAEQLAQLLRDYDDKYVSSFDVENNSNKKNVLGVLTSVALGAATIFVLAKKGYKGAASVISDIAKNDTVQKLSKKITDMSATTKAGQRISDVAQGLSNKIAGSKAIQKAKAIGFDNIVAGAASLGTTAYVATVDGNHDGIPDIAQKGVNAYKNALGQADAIKDIIQLVS